MSPLALALCPILSAAPSPPGDALRSPFKHAAHPPPAARAVQAGWDVEHYSLEVDVPASMDRVAVTGQITAIARRDSPGPLLLHARLEPEGERVTLLSAQVDGQDVSWTQGEGSQILFDVPQRAAGEALSLTASWEAFVGGEGSPGLLFAEGVLFSFHEPEYARRWLLLYDDPADKATLEWSITAPGELTAAANGEPSPPEEIGAGRRRWRFSLEEPIATYLMAVHLAEYETLSQETSGGIPITHYILPGTSGPASETFGATPEIIDTFSGLFGPFPWSRYSNAVAPFGGAMEHTTVTTFGAGLIGEEWGELVNAHEIAHHWWGDWVTLAEWPEIWLNEGFASYGEVLWYEHLYGEEGRRLYVDAQRQSYLAWREYEGRFALYDPDYMWGGTVYDKGSIVLDMLRDVVGDEVFFSALQRYGERFGGGNATSEELRAVFEEVCGDDLGWFFDPWVYTPGEPSYKVSFSQQRVSRGWQIDVTVEQTGDGLWTMPVELAWTDPGGREVREGLWIEGRTSSASFCAEGEVSDFTFDPDGERLYLELEVVEGEPAPEICGDELRAAGCACSGGGSGGPWLAAALALQARRRRASPAPRRGSLRAPPS